MAGGTNNIKRPGYTPGGQNVGGQMPPQYAQPGFAGQANPGQPQPNPAQMEEWKKQFGNWNPGGGNVGWNPGGGGGGGPDPKTGQYPPMNIPGLLPGGPQAQNPPGFPGYANLPKNWQDEGTI